MVQQMKMQEAQALAEIPLEETLQSDSSSDKDPKNTEDEDDDSLSEYDEEQDKATVEMQIKRARYASQGRPRAATAGTPAAQKTETKVYGRGQPIVVPAENATGKDSAAT